MKIPATILLAVVAAAFPPRSGAQIPNPGFELWNLGEPTNWTTDNYLAVPVMQTSVAHSGTSALQGTVVAYPPTLYPPTIITGAGITQRYSTFSGWYTFSPVGGDSLYGWVILYAANSPIGYAFFSNTTSRGGYTGFSVSVNYINGGTPDSCAVAFGITGTVANSYAVHEGSTFMLDDVALSGSATTGLATRTAEPLAYTLGQNFPNPFNPSTVITYQVSATGPVRLAVYDILGRELGVLVDGVQTAGVHEVRFSGSGLASGVYVYRIQAAGFIQQKKMILEK